MDELGKIITEQFKSLSEKLDKTSTSIINIEKNMVRLGATDEIINAELQRLKDDVKQLKKEVDILKKEETERIGKRKGFDSAIRVVKFILVMGGGGALVKFCDWWTKSQ